MATVLLIGTLDTKGPETAYLRDRVREQGCDTLVLDSGILGEAVGIEADFNRAQVAEAAGTTIDALRNAGTRGKAVEGMLAGVRKITLDLLAAGKIQGAVALGGAEGSVLAAAAMKELPIGFPKLIVSPIASGQRKFAPFVGIRDVMVMHSVVDILGLNPISRAVFDSAAAAVAGMAKAYASHPLSGQGNTIVERPAIAATMLGNTTKPLMRIRPHIEERGWDFVIFHANGVGGRAMEDLIAQGQFAAVLDYTLSEVAGQIAGGFHVGGATRLDAAAQSGVPQLIVPGCLDFIVFGAKHEIPEQFKDRPTYYHNPEFTLVRLTPDEQVAATQFVVEKLNRATGPVSVIVPLGGGSVMDIEGGAFWLPELNRRCWNILKDGLNKNIRYREIEAHINSDAFADAVLDELLQMMN
ncbi:MAG: Tm-1-like ATP-binding domain-containing protein [Anaerolineae bacterium]